MIIYLCLLLLFATTSFAQDPRDNPWCDQGWRPQVGGPADLKGKGVTDINGNLIEYIGACAPLWNAVSTPPIPPGPLLVKPMLTCGVDKFLALYYPNMEFAGSPAWVACEDKIAGDPVAPNIPLDQFSVRWSGIFNFTGGATTFTATTDDGIRVFVDGTLIIDAWFDQAPTNYIHTLNLTPGYHLIAVDFYENGGGAEATLVW
jgi:hypothetical protein